jgi:hypothetical protein
MIPRQTSQSPMLLIACMVIVLGLHEVLVARSSGLATGSVGGTVRVVWADHTVPLAGARLELMSISHEGGRYQATTDATGRYTIDLPQRTYKLLLAWMGGECSEINRASFRLDVKRASNF